MFSVPMHLAPVYPIPPLYCQDTFVICLTKQKQQVSSSHCEIDPQPNPGGGT